MKVRISWANGVVQEMTLVTHNCLMKNKRINYFNMNSPIYNAIANGTYFIDLGYGQHHFKMEEV